MAFPGGRLEPGDPSPLAAAVRETREEVALDLERDAELLGSLDQIRATARGRVLPMAIHPFVFRLTGQPDLRPNAEEVSEALWIPLAHLQDPAAIGVVPYTLGGQRFELPSIEFEGHTIWGLTYQMLMRLFRIMAWI
jgi:8-oxo-dGTP pyrophosphatase MutT (NUDIX family)